MQSSNLKYGILIVSLTMIAVFYSCRDTFDEEFRKVPIDNNAPTFTEIDTTFLSIGFESAALDLAAFFTDAESDPISYTASSSNENVVNLSISGSVLTLMEGGELGSAEITINATDGEPENEVTTSFSVVVRAGSGPTFIYGFDFTLPNGTMNDDIVWPTGATVEFSSGSGGVTRTIQDGASLWDLPAEGDLLLTLTLDVPADISDKPTFQLDYADSKNSFLYLEFYDASGGFASAELELIANDAETNTLTVDLSELSGDLDLTQFSGMAMEKFIDWESDEVENGTSWIIDNFYIAYKEGSGEGNSFEYCQDYTLAQGTKDADITWPAGATVEFSSGSGGVTRTIQDGASLWDLPAEGDLLLTLTLDVPADISDKPTFQLDYADSKNSFIYLEFYDASGGFASAELELIANDSGFNTLTVDLSEFNGDLDLTQFSGMAMEKFIDWESDEVENGTSWIIDNLCISKN